MDARIARAEVEIEAPIDVVWQVLSDLPRYAEWNPFVVGVDQLGQPTQPGSYMVLRVQLPGGSLVRSREQITRVQPPGRDGDGAALEWEYRGILHWLRMSSNDREQRLEVLAPHRTRYRNLLTYRGWASPVLPMRAIRAGFIMQAEALRVRSEWLAAGTPMPWKDYAAARAERRPA